MLTFTLQTHESLRIGDETKVSVLAVKGHQVRIGVAAPRGIPVHREEIWRQIQDGAPDAKSPSSPEGREASG